MTIAVQDRLERIPVDALVPYARNSRTHSDAQIEQIAASIREFGFTNPVLVDEAGGIIAGHGRVMAARLLGMAEVPCLRLSHLSEQQKRAYVIADNKLALNAGWDDDMLRAEIEALRVADYDLDLLGFRTDEIADLFAAVAEENTRDPEDAPPLEETAVSKPGDVWILGPHRVLCGSSLEISAWDALMAGEHADICWTDPPYNVAYESKLAGKIKNDDMADVQFRGFLRDALVAVFAVLKPGAPIYVAHSDTEGLNFRWAFRESGLKLSGCLIWRKDQFVLGRSDYQWMHEPILYGWRPGSKHRWYGGRKLSTVLEHGEGGAVTKLADGRWAVRAGDAILIVSGEATIEEHPLSVLFHEKPRRSAEHPTMKPVGLIEKMLRASARAGDIVVDGFGGSGSTLIAADRMGMSARLVELDPKFVDVIVRRWQEYTGRVATLASSGMAFDEAAAAALV